MLEVADPALVEDDTFDRQLRRLRRCGLLRVRSGGQRGQQRGRNEKTSAHEYLPDERPLRRSGKYGRRGRGVPAAGLDSAFRFSDVGGNGEGRRNGLTGETEERGRTEGIGARTLRLMSFDASMKALRDP